MSVFRRVFLCVLLALPGAAQSLAFEVVSIKPDNTQDFRNMRMKVLPARPFLGDRPARANAAGLRLQPADDLSERLSGVPDWANREQYDIEAKPPVGAFPAVPGTLHSVMSL